MNGYNMRVKSVFGKIDTVSISYLQVDGQQLESLNIPAQLLKIKGGLLERKTKSYAGACCWFIIGIILFDTPV